MIELSWLEFEELREAYPELSRDRLHALLRTACNAVFMDAYPEPMLLRAERVAENVSTFSQPASDIDDWQSAARHAAFEATMDMQSLIAELTLDLKVQHGASPAIEALLKWIMSYELADQDLGS